MNYIGPYTSDRAFDPSLSTYWTRRLQSSDPIQYIRAFWQNQADSPVRTKQLQNLDQALDEWSQSPDPEHTVSITRQWNGMVAGADLRDLMLMAIVKKRIQTGDILNDVEKDLSSKCPVLSAQGTRAA